MGRRIVHKVSFYDKMGIPRSLRCELDDDECSLWDGNCCIQRVIFVKDSNVFNFTFTYALPTGIHHFALTADLRGAEIYTSWRQQPRLEKDIRRLI